MIKTMGTLYLVRHGQASFGAADYDQLSPLGHQQCVKLGEYWRARGLRFDAVLTGSLKRHAQSFAGIAEGMPGIDGFEVARRLKANPATAAAPIIFMTGLSDTEHVEAAFAAGGVDYVTKPIRPREVLARIAAHLRSARAQRQARNALDAFGHASMAVHEQDGRCVWQTALARALMAEYFSGGHFERGRLPPEMMLWLHREALRRRAGAEPAGLTVLPQVSDAGTPIIARGAKRLSFTLHAVDPDALGEGQWLIVMREADDAALMDGLIHGFKLTAREAEVLYWVVKGKTNLDIGDILGSSPRTVQKHLEHVFEKLGVETRTAAAAMAMGKVRGLEAGR